VLRKRIDSSQSEINFFSDELSDIYHFDISYIRKTYREVRERNNNLSKNKGILSNKIKSISDQIRVLEIASNSESFQKISEETEITDLKQQLENHIESRKKIIKSREKSKEFEKKIANFINLKNEEIHLQPIVEKERSLIIKLRRKKREIFDKTLSFPFEVFPIGEWTTETIKSRFANSGIVLAENEIMRLKKIKEVFKPDGFGTGKRNSKGYEGYFVFIFKGINKVIAENPLKDNATYIIKGTWEEILEILKLTKMQVRNHPQAKCAIHRNEKQWIGDLYSKFYY